MAKVTRIDHIAILTGDIDQALSFWCDGLGLPLEGMKDVPVENSLIAFLEAGGSEIELVKPTSTDSGLARYLEKRGPGMHHICLEVDNISEMLAQLQTRGVQMIHETPMIAENGRKYAFIHPKSAFGVLVELYEIPGQILENSP